VHLLKHSLEIVSTDEGILIDSSDEQFENADSPRIDTREPGSNVKLESFVQSEKHDFEMISIDEGIQIDRSETQ
jgi:anti-sigma regulatory factor (Ser/Thr protein kinase)